jgi:hypothetical protein
MKPVSRNEILSLADYEPLRERFRARVIEEKKVRRSSLGPKMSFLFENHDTALLQIQEMIRTERITRESAILHEIETYNALVPRDGELSASFFIEIVDKAERDAFLEQAKGIEKSITLDVDGTPFPARLDEKLLHEDRASAVMYARFVLSPEALAAFAAGHRGGKAPHVQVSVNHAVYQAKTVLGTATFRSLAEDLFGS